MWKVLFSLHLILLQAIEGSLMLITLIYEFFFGNFSQIYHIVFALVRSRMTLELILITSGLSGI